jgi:hypothetical protein
METASADEAESLNLESFERRLVTFYVLNDMVVTIMG